MSDTNTETAAKTSKKPAFIAYSIREREGKESKWRDIGVAFAHDDGKGFTILTDVAPLNGRITLRVPSEKK